MPPSSSQLDRLPAIRSCRYRRAVQIAPAALLAFAPGNQQHIGPIIAIDVGKVLDCEGRQDEAFCPSGRQFTRGSHGDRGRYRTRLDRGVPPATVATRISSVVLNDLLKTCLGEATGTFRGPPMGCRRPPNLPWSPSSPRPWPDSEPRRRHPERWRRKCRGQCREFHRRSGSARRQAARKTDRRQRITVTAICGVADTFRVPEFSIVILRQAIWQGQARLGLRGAKPESTGNPTLLFGGATTIHRMYAAGTGRNVPRCCPDVGLVADSQDALRLSGASPMSRTADVCYKCKNAVGASRR